MVYIEGNAGTMEMPNLVEAAAALKQAEGETAFWAEHYQEYVRKYPDQFVAVHDGKVVATSPDLESLLEQLAARSLNVQRVSTRFIASDRYHYLL